MYFKVCSHLHQHFKINSLESGILISFSVDNHDEHNQNKEFNQNEKQFSVFLEPRSMLIFSDQVYQHYLHSIDESDHTHLTEDLNILNVDQLKGLQLGDTVPRKKRVSLTYRIVKRTINKNKWIRL